MGLTHFAVLSDGWKVATPRLARKASAKLRRAQKEYARRQKGSANREKARRKVARAHVRVANTRRDWLHKLSTIVVRENQLIAVEGLAVSGLARTRLARSVHDAGWSMFVAMLVYKAQRGGRRLVRVDRWLPSTRACSAWSARRSPCTPGAPLPAPDTPAPVRFLGQWDANLLVHVRRAQILPEEYRPRVFARNMPQSVPTFLVDGRVAGTWRHVDGAVRCEPFHPLPAAAGRELADEGERLAAFHG